RSIRFEVFSFRTRLVLFRKPKTENLKPSSDLFLFQNQLAAGEHKVVAAVGALQAPDVILDGQAAGVGLAKRDLEDAAAGIGEGDARGHRLGDLRGAAQGSQD